MYYGECYSSLPTLTPSFISTLPYHNYIANMMVKSFAGSGSGSGSEVDGYGSNANFNNPYGIVYDNLYENMIITDYGSNKIRKISSESGLVVTIASGNRIW